MYMCTVCMDVHTVHQVGMLVRQREGQYLGKEGAASKVS
jgi:hypothetical protein